MSTQRFTNFVKLLPLFFLIVLLFALPASAQITQTLTVGTTAVNVIATLPNTTSVEVWQSGGPPTGYTTTSPGINSVGVNAHFIWSQATAYGAGAVVGTIYLSSGIATFSVFESSAGNSNPVLLTAVKPTICAGSVESINVDGSVTCGAGGASWKNQGTLLGIPTIINCSTNLTCSFASGTLTMVASSTAATAWSTITAGTNATALLMGTGGSLGTSGTGTIAATSAPWSGISGTPTTLAGYGVTSVPCSTLPALTGDATSSAGSCATTVSSLQGHALPTLGTSTGFFYDGGGTLAVRVLASGDIPSNAANTSGNAATATALASTPTLCTGGQAATGILANGNATGCFTPSGSGTVTVVSAGSLTSTAIVTGGGSATLQTPSSTATLSSGGNMSLPGTLTLTAITGTQCLHAVSGVISGTGSDCGSGGGGMVWPSTAGIPYWTSGTAWGGAYNASTQIPNTYVPFAAPGAIGGTTPSTGAFTTLSATTGLTVGSSPPSCGSATGIFCASEASTAGTPASGVDYMRANSTTHSFECSLNNGSEAPCNPEIPSSATSGHLVAWGTWPAQTDSGVVAANLVSCAASTAGSVCYYNGSAWALLAGNASGTNCFSENSSGTPSWAACGGNSSVIISQLGYTTPSGTGYIYPSGQNASGTVGASADADMLIPRAGTLGNLYVAISGAESGSSTFTATLYHNDSSSALTCTVGNSVATCHDTTHTVSVSAGDLISIQVTQTTGTGTPGYYYFGVTLQ